MPQGKCGGVKKLLLTKAAHAGKPRMSGFCFFDNLLFAKSTY
jgi:hypothetical protein